jgi:hypothetical protein
VTAEVYFPFAGIGVFEVRAFVTEYLTLAVDDPDENESVPVTIAMNLMTRFGSDGII